MWKEINRITFEEGLYIIVVGLVIVNSCYLHLFSNLPLIG